MSEGNPMFYFRVIDTKVVLSRIAKDKTNEKKIGREIVRAARAGSSSTT
jgi:hypothetical protein